MRHVTIEIPAPCQWINSNQRPSNTLKTPGNTRILWDNRDGPGGACNTTRGLTRSSGTSREGLT